MKTYAFDNTFYPFLTSNILTHTIPNSLSTCNVGHIHHLNTESHLVIIKIMGCCSSKNEGYRRLRKSDYGGENLGEVQYALKELLNTEKTYGADLQFLADKYMEAFRAELFFDKTELIAFNSVVLDLVYTQKMFQQKLEKSLETDHDTALADVICHVSGVFISSEHDFDVYGHYILCMAKVQKLVCENGDPKILKFIESKDAEFKQATDGGDSPQRAHRLQTIGSLMMKPFQRVMMYPIILERIQRKCQDGTVDQQQITKAIQSIKNVGTLMNETMAKHENGIEFQTLLQELGITQYEYEKSSKT